ncbi:UDP-glucose 4-epimerase GalE [Fictibacillus phosphorivorans]|uniref:UDP-glucose 4-epimerase GalE n=1 Tax=Fictibacillus phosphorivorans TaxID=1221500 RepID=UPI0020403FEF|nr:UDP-glucose 4-epimerase GalE [Fictibacillus phosphorivorans]MCM3717709.1 UDP-glucose 4-epimerase GalE [Fictibacillus phosphorivorans]MCM3775609.1 UDP-glucose 4-epimerase GalE [Fictibacillus phosphorivorans]
MAVLITGGAGYIGSHTCVEMLNAGYELIVIDNFSNSKPDVIERIQKITGKTLTFYEATLLDKEMIDTIFSNHEINAVIHFAAYKAVGESVEKPLMYYQNNLISTLNLCEIMDKYGVYNLVFSSSATVYGNPDRVPITEESPLRATNPYGHTKQMTEQILQDLFISNPMWSIASLRYFNPIGAHESGLIGEDPTGIPNNLLPYISQVASGKLPHLNIFGDDYETNDGTGIRDYIHIMDLASGHVKALEHVLVTTGVEAFNLGTGKGHSVFEMIDVFEQVSKKQIKYSIQERRPGDIAVCFADPSKANHVLQWSAKRGIYEMCKDTWKWQTQSGKQLIR